VNIRNNWGSIGSRETRRGSQIHRQTTTAFISTGRRKTVGNQQKTRQTRYDNV